MACRAYEKELRACTADCRKTKIWPGFCEQYDILDLPLQYLIAIVFEKLSAWIFATKLFRNGRVRILSVF